MISINYNTMLSHSFCPCDFTPLSVAVSPSPTFVASLRRSDRPRRHLICSFTAYRLRNHLFFGRPNATAAGPPQPPHGDDGSNHEASGLQSSLSGLKDRLRVFLAVLFWMSLFFWASAWDGRDGGRKKKGFRFKK